MRRSQQLFPINLPWSRLGPVLDWLAAGWIFGTLLQAHPERYSIGLRLAALAVFWVLPFLTGALKIREFRGVLPSPARGVSK
jgi:hypothetical protein